MKIVSNLVLLTMIMLVVSCQKESEIRIEDSLKTKHARLTLNIIEGAGDLHNEGLDYMIDIINPNQTYPNREAQVLDHLTMIDDFFAETYSWTTQSASLYQEFAYEIDNGNLFTNPMQHWSDFMENHSTELNPTEVGFINEVFEVLTDTYTGTQSERSQSIINALELIKVNYNNIDWEVGEGELAGGVLNIALGSSYYWQDNDIGGSPSLEIIIQVDAAGYLWGWGSALADGVGNPNDRIGQGIHTAIEWGLCRWMF